MNFLSISDRSEEHTSELQSRKAACNSAFIVAEIGKTIVQSTSSPKDRKFIKLQTYQTQPLKYCPMIPRLCHAERHICQSYFLIQKLDQLVGSNNKLSINIYNYNYYKCYNYKHYNYKYLQLYASEFFQRLFSPIKFGPIYVYHITNSYFQVFGTIKGYFVSFFLTSYPFVSNVQ